MKLNSSKLLRWFHESYPELVAKMRAANHNYSRFNLNPYHLEGDVFCHTMLVLQQADMLLEKEYNYKYYNELLVCALLHDIGKPSTRKKNDEKKRVSFFSHDAVSAIASYDICDLLEKNFDIELNKEIIVDVIARHTEVFKLTPEQLSDRYVNQPEKLELIQMFRICDHAGRFHDGEKKEQVWSIPKFNDNKMDESKPTLTVLIGLPAVGKSYYTKGMEGEFEILSRDDIVMQMAEEKGYTDYNEAFDKLDQNEVNNKFDKKRKELIKSGKDIVLDMNNLSRKARRRNMNGFNNYNKVAKVFLAPFDLIFSSNQKRKDKTVPNKVYNKMITQFYPPGYDEFLEIEWIMR